MGCISPPSLAPAVGDDPAAGQEAEAEVGSEPLAPADAVAAAEAALQHAQQVVAVGKVVASNATAALVLEQEVLAAVVKVCLVPFYFMPQFYAPRCFALIWH